MSKETERQTVDIDVGLPDPDDATRYRVTWENRRRMAWVSLYGLIGITFVYTMIFLWAIEADAAEKMKHLSDIYFYFIMTMASLVLGYMGTTSISALGLFTRR